MVARSDKRWLKSVADPDLVGAFEDSQFDAGEYAKSFYEQREASHAAQRVEKLEGLKRQTEYALREEVVRNYKAFMHATEEIRSMETGIQTLKDLMVNTGVTLETFRSVRLVETVKPPEKTGTGRWNSRAAPGKGGDSAAPEDDNGDLKGVSASRGLKLPEWLDQAPIELEELLLERKHQEAVVLIRRVRDFSSNVQNATNLGRGVEKIFQRVETMASGMADRLLAEINAANTLTVWGFREHKSNFALLIALGHGEKAAISFVGERSAMIRRSLRLVEVTADPLSYIGVLSDTFFSQVYDAVTAFIKLFCKSARIHERRAQKSGKSTAYYQIYQGVRDSGTAPFCRLVVWVNQQIDQYAVLMGRQIRAVTMGPQRVTREQSSRRGSWSSSGDDPGFRLGPVASSLFSIVSLMLEEGFAAAARLNTMGFPVGVQLASRLVPDVSHFLTTYVDSVKENLVEAIRKDAFVSMEFKLVRPEALYVGTPEEEESEAVKAYLTSSARILVLEARDILDYALVLLEPPPAEEEALAITEATGNGAAGASADAADAETQEQEAASYYTRDEFLELEPVIVTSLDQLLRTYLKETMACMRARRDDLSTNQSTAVTGNLAEFGRSYVPLIADWCAELLPEIADEEEVTNLRSLKAEFQRSAQNPFRTRDSGSSGGTAGRASSSGKPSSKPPSHRSTSSSKSSATSSPTAGDTTEAATKGSSDAVADKPSRTYPPVKTSVTLRTVAGPAADGSDDVASSSTSSSKKTSPSGVDTASAPYTQGLRPSQIISGPGGVQGSSRAAPRRSFTVTSSTSGNSSISPSSEAEAAAAAAKAAAKAAAVASAGGVMSPPAHGGGTDSTRILSRRPTMTIKAAREAREAKARAVAEARAAREAGK